MGSLRSRIALAYIALIACAMVALGAVLFRVEQARFRAALDRRLTAEGSIVAEAVTPLLSADPSISAVDPLVKRLGAESGARITVIAPDGVVLGDSENDPARMENHGSRPEVVQALSAGSGRATRRSATERRDFTYRAVRVQAGGTLLGIARISLPSSEVNADTMRIATSVAVAALITTLAALAIAFGIARAVTRPVEQLRRAALALAGGAPVAVATGGCDEVQDLARAFDEMSQRLHSNVVSLHQERARLQATLAASADMLFALDANGVVRYANPAAEAFFGESGGRAFAEVVRRHELAEAPRAIRSAERFSTPPIRLDERGQWVQATATPIAFGGEWAALVVIRDITDIQRADTARREFVANVSHELRTPLAGLKAVVETLEAGALSDPDAAHDFLRRADAEVDRLIHLVDELLQLARLEAGIAMQPTAVKPGEVLASVVERFAHQAERAQVALVLDLPEQLPVLHADPAQLGRAIGNLVHNALKFTPAGGTVRITAREEPHALTIEVRDTGRGIEPADLPRIFERFYVADRSRSRGETGLGLAIVKHVALAHGGSVEARSRPGAGSTFSVRLPLPSPSRLRESGPAAAAAIPAP